MKRLFLLLFILSIQVLFGQEEGLSLPQKIVPVSPEASSLGKFGDVPINLSIGKLNFSIPLYTIKVGKFSYPIYLQYNNLGLMPEEDPSIVGFGWTLSAEGMISRQIRGLNDDNSLGYLNESNGMQQHQNEYPDSQYWLDLFQGALSGSRDVEPDKFIINAGGLSANFLFNDKGEPIFYPFNNYKVSYDRASNRITKFNMLDDGGNQYLFGTKEQNINPDNTNMLHPVSTWKLDTIRIANTSNFISFDYLGSDTDHLYIKETHYEEKYQGVPFSLEGQFKTREKVFSTTIIQKLLHYIYFPDGKIEFITKTVPSDSYANNKYYLDKIIVYEGEADNYRLLKTYQFVYNNLLSNYRLLKKIRLFDAGGSEQPFYTFDYYDETQIPDIIDYASQDTWGYYNGKNNQNLVDGDRSVDFISTRLGALDSIHYPTGGSTQIKYGLNRIKLDSLYSLFQYYDQCLTKPINKSLIINASNTNEFPEQFQSDTLTINCEQTIKVTFLASVGGSNGMAESQANMTVISGEANCDPYSGCSDSCSMQEFAWQEQGGQGGDSGTVHNSHTAYFQVLAGTTIVFEVTAIGTAESLASIVVEYSDFCDEGDIEVGGLRIIETQDISNTGITETQHYQYIDENGKSSGNLCFFPIPLESIYFLINNGHIFEGFFLKYYSTSQLPMVGFQGSTTLYDRVITYSNSANNGKIINEFDNDVERLIYQGYPTDFHNHRNGKLKSKQIYRKTANVFKLVNESVIDNDTLSLDPIPNSLVGNPFVEGHYVHMIGYYTGYIFVTNPYYYRRTKQINLYQQEINHFDNGDVETQTNYTYDIQRGYLKEQTTTGSDGKQTKVTNIYPYEVDNLNSLGAGNQALNADELVAYQDLTQKNIIATPIQVEKEINSNEVSSLQKRRITYKTKPNTNFTLPHKISVLKEVNGSNADFDDSFIYHHYNNYGNTIEVSKAGGTHIYYIYGYQHTKPIAKIVNFTQAQAQNLQSEINNVIAASDNDVDTTSEDALRAALSNLRQALPNNTQITTYTYDPLIGVTSITQPNGETEYYEYDNFNRLKYVKNSEGKILKENEYHYKE